MEEKEIVYGKNPVEGILETNPKRINKIYLVIGVKFDPKIRNILSLARQNKIVVLDIPKEKMDKLTDGVHQGVAASVSPIEFIELEDLLPKIKDKKDALLIILDKVEDPHNLGSIIRTAAAANVDGIIIPKRHSSQITSTVEKASAGTVDKVAIIQVTNLSATIETLKENNFWIIGAEGSAETYYFNQKYDMNCALVMGGENQGISSLVKKNCDMLVKIPMSDNVNSLNVANAASILIYEIVRQRI
ncbi:MAG: 23S rRNA (guanosine(2251)-2'-O)-methyltransferase RlmB [Candidatus Melainabacteria bacterium GWA2_34_9]|nr:MAG: 23S rRNA (guanosine(2251)-2'-O)-methyltransferase RlmB [Candidatus Melainabacteria bacterium GWA2_34_9]